MSAPSKLDELIALAKEPSSARRRELLREVTDLFFTASGPHGPEELKLFDGVLTALADEMELEVRAELAERMADAHQAPRELLARLARDEAIDVAGPVLRRSAALTEDDLLQVARTRGQDHLRAISERRDLSEAVSEPSWIAATTTPWACCCATPSAPLSRRAAETVVDRAAANPELHQAVIDRQTPADRPAERDVFRGRGAAARADHGAQRQRRPGGSGSRARRRPHAAGRARRRPAVRLRRSRGPRPHR